jgi:hypothetical protein
MGISSSLRPKLLSNGYLLNLQCLIACWLYTVDFPTFELCTAIHFRPINDVIVSRVIARIRRLHYAGSTFTRATKKAWSEVAFELPAR